MRTYLDMQHTLRLVPVKRQKYRVGRPYPSLLPEKQVTFVFKDTLSPELFQPIHVVTIACLIEFLVNVEGHTIRISML